MFKKIISLSTKFVLTKFNFNSFILHFLSKYSPFGPSFHLYLSEKLLKCQPIKTQLIASQVSYEKYFYSELICFINFRKKNWDSFAWYQISCLFRLPFLGFLFISPTSNQRKGHMKQNKIVAVRDFWMF